MAAEIGEAQRERRFPWGYFVFATSPVWVTGLSMLALMSGGFDGWFVFDLLFVLELLVGALAISVLVVGIVRIVRGGARTHPAVRWLMLIPVAAWAAAALLDRLVS